MPSLIPDGAPLIALTRVTKIYGHGDTEVRALTDMSFEIAQGEFAAVVGASGSGKSTCMNVLGCLDLPTTGSYRFLGLEVTGLNIDQLAIVRRSYIGFIFQGYNLLARTSALENVELPLLYRRVPLAERRALAIDALRSVGLDGREHHTPAELSGGQQQRVAIARAMVTNPSLLLADEPTGNLDSGKKGEIMVLLTELNRTRGTTIVIVTHEPDIARWASRILNFRDGLIESDRQNAPKAV
jgi:putative ABC transport system ATP-binding protein